MKFEVNIIKHCLKETIMWSKLTNVKIILLENSEIYNIEMISTQLVSYEEWRYYYFIPTEIFNKNLMLIGYVNNIKNVKIINNTLKPEKIYFDINDIIEIFATQLAINSAFYKFHSLKYIDQIYFCDYLDMISYGVINWLPQHWGVISLSKFNINWEELLDKYYTYLKDNNLTDSLESVKLFYNSKL